MTGVQTCALPICAPRDDFLTAVARGAAYEVSGPGRVLFYVRMLWVEHLNLRLCIAAVLTPLDRADVRTRLRNG